MIGGEVWGILVIGVIGDVGIPGRITVFWLEDEDISWEFELKDNQLFMIRNLLIACGCHL